MKTETMTVIGQKQVAVNTFLLTLTGELVREMEKPGQFVFLNVPDESHVLQRPISICEINQNGLMVRLLYRLEGAGTQKIARIKSGETIDVMGPLGNGFDIQNQQAEEVVWLIGGGIGVPPLYELSKQLVTKGCKPVHFLGFATKEAVFFEEKFAALGETHLATIDGSLGIEGTVATLWEQQRELPTAIFACGPHRMLQAIEEKFHGVVPVQLSIEERMACGMGACFGCVHKVKNPPNDNEYVKVCTDGPVFESGKVVL